MDDIVMDVCYRLPEQQEVEKAFFRQLEESKFTNGVYSQNQKGFINIIPREWWGTMGHGLLPGRKAGPQHTGDLIPGRVVWEDATEPRMPSLRHGTRQCLIAALGLRQGTVMVSLWQDMQQELWQAKELQRRWAAAHCQDEWARDRQALCRGWTAPRSLLNGIIPWIYDMRTNKNK